MRPPTRDQRRFWPRTAPPAAPAERPLPDPSFVIAIDSFTVMRGQLVRVPNFFYQARREGGSAYSRDGVQGHAAAGVLSVMVETWGIALRIVLIEIGLGRGCEAGTVHP